MFSSENRTDLELISGDIFLIPGDYIIAECTSVFDSMCQFLVYFTYKNLPYKYVDENAYTCQADNHPDLFKCVSFFPNELPLFFSLDCYRHTPMQRKNLRHRIHLVLKERQVW